MGLPAADVLAKPFTPRQCSCGNGKVYTSQHALDGHYRHSPSCNPKNRPAAPMPIPMQLHRFVRFGEQPLELASQPACQPASQPLAGSWVPEAFIEPAQPAAQPATVPGWQLDWQSSQLDALNATLSGIAMVPAQLNSIEQRLNQQPQAVQQTPKAAAKPMTWWDGFFAWWATLNTPQQIGLVLFGGFVTWQIALAWSRSTAPARASSGGLLGYAAKKAVDRVFKV